MNDHNLDDLIIDDVEPQQNQKTKSFLTIIALAIVVLIVAIIFTKILLKSPEQNQLTFEQEETEMISPDLTLQSAPEPEEKQAEPIETPKAESILEPPKEITLPEKEEIPAPLQETITVEEAAPEKPEAADQKSMVEKVSESVQNLVDDTALVSETKDETPVPAPMPKPVEETNAVEKKEVIEEPASFPVEPVIEEKKIEETQQEVKKTPEAMIERVKERPKPRPVNVITRPSSKPENVITRPQTSKTSKGTYYIQVGAFRTSPSQRFLDRIKRSGFNYIVTKRSKSGLKKLLIGPYQNRTEADNALIEVKDRINKKAFLHKKN